MTEKMGLICLKGAAPLTMEFEMVLLTYSDPSNPSYGTISRL